MSELSESLIPILGFAFEFAIVGVIVGISTIIEKIQKWKKSKEFYNTPRRNCLPKLTLSNGKTLG